MVKCKWCGQVVTSKEVDARELTARTWLHEKTLVNKCSGGELQWTKTYGNEKLLKYGSSVATPDLEDEVVSLRYVRAAERGIKNLLRGLE